MKKYIIGPNDCDQRLDKFVHKTVKNLPETLLYKYIRLKRIKVNSKRAAVSQRLCEGDTVELYINDEFFGDSSADFMSAPASLEIVYEDENILLADKKPGLVVHEDDSGAADTLIARIKRYLYDKGEYDPEKENSFAPALCNRIDRNTGGIVIAAKNAKALRILDEKIKLREIRKFYLCIVCGVPEPREGVLEGYLQKDSAEKKVHVSAERKENSLPISTRYRVISERDGLSLIEAELLTGRTHQIRAHFASIGHPLLGDGKYGVNSVNRAYGLNYQALYSYKLRFSFKSDAGILNCLNGREFKADKIWFETEFLSGKLRKR